MIERSSQYCAADPFKEFKSSKVHRTIVGKKNNKALTLAKDIDLITDKRL